MEKSNRELESLVSSQQKQLARYETRLKDVVTAYKSLLKEKEALDASVSALSGSTSTHENIEKIKPSNVNDQATAIVPSSTFTSNDNDLKMQISTIMNSLATLSAEKSRMEASFQADKKQLRQENAAKDKTIKDLQDKLKLATIQSGLEVEKVKSKLIVERHDREKDINDHMIMVRELQKLLSDERHLKDNLEMQLNNLKIQFAQADNADSQIRELNAELEQAKRKIKEVKSIKQTPVTVENSLFLRQLQNEIASLKQQHSIAIKNEQKRALQAEERYKKLAIVHEDRVANLESRLAELSATVGTYDRMRQLDQESILKLKEKIVHFETNSDTTQNTIVEAKHWDVNSLIDEISQLKKMLLVENAKQSTPQDISKIFSTGNDHTDCIDQYEKLKIEYETYKSNIESVNNTMEIQKNHIKTLQDKVHVLNRNIDEQEDELKNKSNEHASEIKMERNKWKELICSMEMDFRSKLAELEQQLHKQRERSLTLLEEKESEIKSLKASFESLIPGNGIAMSAYDNLEDPVDSEKMKTKKLSTSNLTSSLAANNSAGVSTQNAEYHMLHYVHELSRKEVEITALRKAKHAAESALRQALQDKVTSQEELHDRIISLEENVDRLERCKSREGANLEYLKNVILSFLISTDSDSKRHMVNAIGAVLKFSPTELKAINNYFTKTKING